MSTKLRVRGSGPSGSLPGDLLDRAFGGSASSLVLGALESRRASRSEIDEIRKLLDGYEGGKK